jgi:hypothetical protein
MRSVTPGIRCVGGAKPEVARRGAQAEPSARIGSVASILVDRTTRGDTAPAGCPGAPLVAEVMSSDDATRRHTWGGWTRSSAPSGGASR